MSDYAETGGCPTLSAGASFMLNRNSIGALLAFALCVVASGAQAFDESKYPNLKGQWNRVGPPRWLARGEKPPLTPEYQAEYARILADQEAGGTGNWPSTFCIPQGMPAMMNLFDPMEIVVTPEITYVLISHINDSYRRIFTDGREWPPEDSVEKTYAGYSIGHWVDVDGDGKYDVLEVETRYFKGPRAFESTGLPLHGDNESIIKERIYLDKGDANVLWNDITVYDHALSKPWTSHRKAVRTKDFRPVWDAEVCPENNAIVRIGKEAYFLSSDGYLMPMKKDQPPPDLSYFGKRP
jgi:hypothetical protein